MIQSIKKITGISLSPTGIGIAVDSGGYLYPFDKSQFLDFFDGEDGYSASHPADLYTMVSRIFCAFTISTNCLFDIYRTNDDIFVEMLSFWPYEDNIKDAYIQILRNLPIIDGYMISYTADRRNRIIEKMVCEIPSTRVLKLWGHEIPLTKKQKLWKCETSFEGGGKKGWFHVQNETHVAWAIMIVFAYKDKKELRIEIDEKTGEILDIFMFSPIEGITL